MSDSLRPVLSIKHDWYQTSSTVVIIVLIKNLKEDQLKITFTDSQVEMKISVPEFEKYSQCFNVSHKIVPEDSCYGLTSSKIEIQLAKTEAIRWEKLEGKPAEHVKVIPQGPSAELSHPPSYPTSMKGKDWNQIEKDIKKQEEQEKPEGEEALNKLFREIYGQGSDEVRKAMNKSFMESGGTVLSTNWNEVSKTKVEVKPPDGMEFKKWDS